MGGDISVQAEAGVGTTWTITLPAERAVTELDSAKQFDLAREIQHVEREIALSRAQDQRLLVADDSPSNRMVLEKMLRNAGHPVDSVSDGLEVLAALKEREYAAVLLDIAMPRMDGLTACKRIRELPGAYKKIPLVALTAHTSDSDQELVYGAGFDAFLTKPTSDGLLQATVQRVVARSTKVAVAKRPQDNRLGELNKVMGDEKLRLLLDQFSSELELRQQSLGVLQSGEKVLDLPLLARTARTFGFGDLAVVAEQLLSEMMKSDTSDELKSLASVNAPGDQLTTQSPAMLALIREVHSVHLLVQEYVAKNLDNSTIE
jgi:CheY-like chemotaxis protein